MDTTRWILSVGNCGVHDVTAPQPGGGHSKALSGRAWCLPNKAKRESFEASHLLLAAIDGYPPELVRVPPSCDEKTVSSEASAIFARSASPVTPLPLESGRPWEPRRVGAERGRIF